MSIACPREQTRRFVHYVHFAALAAAVAAIGGCNSGATLQTKAEYADPPVRTDVSPANTLPIIDYTDPTRYGGGA